MTKQKPVRESKDKNLKNRKRVEKSEAKKDVHEETLDQTIADSFPASDPPSSIPDPDEDAA